MRKEKDFLGELYLEDNDYFGIHTKRALSNFEISYKNVNIEIIKSMAIVKLAASKANLYTGKLSKEKQEVIEKACIEIYEGLHNHCFYISAIQGGAGTSTNMNINEVIANIALEKYGYNKGDYHIIHPIEDVNMSQSTNDTYPTAVKISIIRLLRELIDNIMHLQSSLQDKEHEFYSILKIGRTQLQDAVPITLGKEFGAYAEAVSRDRWRLYKIEERIRQINIGGTAIGTGVGADIKYRFNITQELQRLTGYGLARAENLVDNTQNVDLFVEVSGLLKSLAVNLKKISNDLRLMSSGPNSGLNEINLPPLQAGSSIMPKKVNPVIPEMIRQIYYKVSGNDIALSMAAADGEFELNASLPLIADLILENIELLRDGIKLFNEKTIKGITANKDVCLYYLKKSWSPAAVLIDKIGYDKISDIINKASLTGKTYLEIIKEEGLLSTEELCELSL